MVKNVEIFIPLHCNKYKFSNNLNISSGFYVIYNAAYLFVINLVIHGNYFHPVSVLDPSAGGT